MLVSSHIPRRASAAATSTRPSFFFLPADNPGPGLADVQHAPRIPGADNDLTVTVTVRGDATRVELRYRVMFEDERTVTMHDDGAHGDGAAHDGVYGGIIPSAEYDTGQLVRYAVEATDAADNHARLPTDAASDNTPHYFGTVPGAETIQSHLPILHWFVAEPILAEDRSGTRASVFYNGRYYDNIFVRLRGGSNAESWPKKHFKFDFNPDDHFVFAPDQAPVEEFNLNSTWSDKAYIRQVLAWETYRDAGVAHSLSFPLRVHQNGAFYSVAIFIEQPDKRYLKRQGYDEDGALYKMYTDLSEPDDPDNAEDAEKKTRLDEDDSDLRALIAGIHSTGEERARFLFDNVDIPQMVNYLAATTLMHDNDHVTKNYYLYRDTNGTGEWMMFPWDKDLTFGRNYLGGDEYLADTLWADIDPFSHPLFGDAAHPKVDDYWNGVIDALYAHPTVRAMYLRRLRTLMDQMLQPPGTSAGQLYYERRMDALYAAIRDDVALDAARWPITWGDEQSFAEALEQLEQEYLAPRRAHLYGTHTVRNGGIIPAAQSSAPPIHFGTHALDYSTPTHNAEYVTVQNPNPYAVDLSGWTLRGAITLTLRPGVVIPADGTLYVSPDVTAFRNRSVSPRGQEEHFVQGNYGGRLSRHSGAITLHNPDGAQVDRLAYTATASPLANRLIIREINFNPSPAGAVDGDELEFIELQNVSATQLDLSGVRFSDGIDYIFPASARLEPDGFVVLVSNAIAFAQRYPTVTPFNVYANRLSDNGERITLSDSMGYPIVSLAYAATGLWPAAADGAGHTLVSNGFHVDATSPCAWRPSANVFGSPGKDDPPGRGSNCVAAQYLPLVHRP